ncbi:MAG: GNAT family N-acetyltransferase [Bacteroidales bacterium]|jgi:hypothetical protein|nr:GNAT family N-acetyltransferase [Bacteroidales bacterium]
MTNKDRYEIFCKEQKNIPLFLQKWWMDAVCAGKEWDVFLYEENSEVKAVFVFHYIKRYGFKFILQPQLTQYNGIWINYPPHIPDHKKRSLEKKIIYFFIGRLDAEKYIYYEQAFHYSFVNWLPFYWKGYTQTTRYTYQLKDLSDMEQCFAQFSSSKQRQIRKAEKELIVDFDCSEEEFYRELTDNLHLQNKKFVCSKQLFLHVYQACVSRKQGKIIAIRNQDRQLYAAAFVVWDSASAYLLLYTIHPHYRSSGASSRMVWEAIQFVSDKVAIFDFEGSINETVESSYSRFGTEQVACFTIKKSKSFFFDMLLKMKKQIESHNE